MAIYADQTGRSLELPTAPRRIVSTVPSQTELLHDLGLNEQVVGITAYCVHPSHWLKEKEVIGGTKDLQIDKIKGLKPDLIVANKEENIREQIEKLATDIPVYVSDIKSPRDTLAFVNDLGEILGVAERSKKLTDGIEKSLDDFGNHNIEGSCCYFIWKEPYMVVSNDTFIQSMVDLTGLHNPVKHNDQRYPQITLDQLSTLAPDVVLLSSEPYRFTTADLHDFGHRFPESVIKLVDGEMMSWYGSRLIKGLRYVKRLRNELDLVLKGRRNGS